MRIDAHTHLNKTNQEPDFARGVQRLIKSADQNKIDKIVLIANTEAGTTCANTTEMLDSIKGNERFFVVGAPNIMNNESQELQLMRGLLQKHKIIGLKLFPGHEPFYPTDSICTPVYELALQYDCPVIIHTGINSGDPDCARYNDPKYIVKVAQKYPNLRIVLAHYFWPRMEYCFDTTKNIANIYYDTSAMADSEVVELSGGIKKVRHILEKTEVAKPNHIIFGSDYDMCDQKHHVKLIQGLNVSLEAKNAIFAQNFLRCCKLAL